GIDIFSNNSKKTIFSIFKPQTNFTTKTSTKDILLNTTSFTFSAYPIHDYVFSEKINPIYLISIIMSKFGISHNHKQKKDKILNDILHSPNNYDAIEKQTYYFDGKQYKINQATDIYIDKFFEENPISLKDYHDLCELAMLIE
ncbi:TPA: hypothetical protein JG849_002920, partial [Enterobacter hormaechei subsp. xiangfangensis]|nr:hypothetical protein [Enterobacter hormaechei subsp. xiangfangensis]